MSFLHAEDSDEDLFTVPDVESGPGDSGKVQGSEMQQSSGQGEGGPLKIRRGRNLADREYRKLKRYINLNKSGEY